MQSDRRKLVIAGGSGFLGQRLVAWFAEQNWEVVVLTRQTGAAPAGARNAVWDGKTLGPWASELEGCEALVNLAGQSVNCRYHARNRKAILASRIESTRVLGEAIARCARPPQAWLNASTATIYQHAFDHSMDEPSGVIAATPEAKDQFSVDVATAWEQAFDAAHAPHTRKVALRTAMVFDTTPGTVYPILRRLVRLGLGGQSAGGRQYVSWLHRTDFCRAIAWIVDHKNLSGPVNIAAPHPLTNSAMMCTIRRACHRPIGLPATRWMLEIGAFFLRTETELVIKSRRVVPARLLASGFEFRFPRLPQAVAELERRFAGQREGCVDTRQESTSPGAIR